MTKTGGAFNEAPPRCSGVLKLLRSFNQFALLKDEDIFNLLN
ncbi:MAG: hypothetical protein ABFD18_14665 [Syntrophomonas sp.]